MFYMKLIPLGGKRGKGKFAKVDDEDYDTVCTHKWYVSVYGYPTTGIYTPGQKVWTKQLTLHHFLMGKQKGMFVDHIDGDKTNALRSNMRWATPAQSAKNTGNSTGKYKGVCFRRGSRINPWKAEIMTDWVKTHIGVFPTEHLAALAYDLWAVEVHGEYARTNFKIERWGRLQ